MGKFVIECPKCGKGAEAKTGFFAKKSIKCYCGHTINVKTEKITSKECSKCKNTVVYDQSLGEPTCPICSSKINTTEDKSKTLEFSCKQCSAKLWTDKSASFFVCPVCDFENDVKKRLMAQTIKKEGLASVIKYEGDNETFVWKHPIEDFNFGSQLIVHESQEAIFFKDGQALDLFGSGRYTLETQKLPLLGKVYDLATDTEGTFHSEVYYINMATQMGIKWGTDSKVRLFEPKTGLHIEIGAGGEFNVKVINSRKLVLKLVGTTGGLTQAELLGKDSGKSFFKSMIMTQVKSYLAQTIKECDINILEIDSHLLKISEDLKSKINTYLDEYGLMMPEFFVSRIVTPDDDPNFRRMKEQFAAEYLLVREEEIREKEALAAAKRKTIEAETAARMKIIAAQGSSEAYRLQAEAEAREMQMKGYTYAEETARQVGLEAMQNGLTGNSSGGTSSGTSGSIVGNIGDIAGLGLTLGAMGSVMGMTQDAMQPIMNTGFANTMKQDTNKPVGWKCTCGEVVAGNFCANCGMKKAEAWDCTCGQKSILGNFCTNCGTQKVSSWNCTCGLKDITGNFCANCGEKRGDK